MRFTKFAQGLLFGFAVLLSSSVFAAPNKGSLQVFDTVTVNGKQLPAGEYSVQWDGKGPDVQLNIVKGHKVMASTPARVVSTDRTPDRDSAILKMNSDGSKSVSEIRFGGKKYALAIGDSGSSSDMGSTR